MTTFVLYLKRLRDSVPLNSNINTGISILQNGKESGENCLEVWFVILLLFHFITAKVITEPHEIAQAYQTSVCGYLGFSVDVSYFVS